MQKDLSVVLARWGGWYLFGAQAVIAHGVLGVDLSQPMIDAATERVEREGMSSRVQLTLAPMDALPTGSHSIDLIVAHGIWNLARSGDEFRRALGEAARMARPAAGLFVFTFSRRTPNRSPARPSSIHSSPDSRRSS